MEETTQVSGLGVPRVIAFTGPKEGVGKTTLVLNLAVAWAEMQKKACYYRSFGSSGKAGTRFLFGY